MKKFDRYTYVNYTNKDGKQVVVAISRHAGQIVKGYAVCDPADEFDLEVGKKLAAARCNKKVLAKKLDENFNRMSEVMLAMEELGEYHRLLDVKHCDLEHQFVEADNEINSILETIN
jgi:hypothetical protein